MGPLRWLLALLLTASIPLLAQHGGGSGSSGGGSHSSGGGGGYSGASASHGSSSSYSGTSASSGGYHGSGASRSGSSRSSFQPSSSPASRSAGMMGSTSGSSISNQTGIRETGVSGHTDWVARVPQVVDAYAAAKFAAREDSLTSKEAKLDQADARLAAERLRPGARQYRISEKEAELAVKRTKLLAKREKAAREFAERARRKPCRGKHCMACPSGRFGRNGCISVGPEIYAGNCELDGFVSAGCGLNLSRESCSFLASRIRVQRMAADRLQQEALAACAADWTGAACAGSSQQGQQARALYDELQRRLYACMAMDGD